MDWLLKLACAARSLTFQLQILEHVFNRPKHSIGFYNQTAFCLIFVAVLYRSTTIAAYLGLDAHREEEVKNIKTT